MGTKKPDSSPEQKDELQELMGEIGELQEKMSEISAQVLKTPPSDSGQASEKKVATQSKLSRDEKNTTPPQGGASQSETSASSGQDDQFMKDFEAMHGHEPWFQEAIHQEAEEGSNPNSILSNDLVHEIQEEIEHLSKLKKEIKGESSEGSVESLREFKRRDFLKAESGNTLSMKIQGDMTLQLTYGEHADQVSLQFHGDFLTVQLPNGTQLRVPLVGSIAS